MTIPPSPNPLPTTEGVTQTKRVRVTFEGDLVEPGMFEVVQLYFDDGSIGDTIAPYLLRYAKIEPISEGVTQGWQDIAAAPRDGSAFLTWNGKNYAIDNYSKGDGDFSNLVMERLVQRIGDADDELRLTTDWQPLPPPPGQNT